MASWRNRSISFSTLSSPNRLLLWSSGFCRMMAAGHRWRHLAQGARQIIGAVTTASPADVPADPALSGLCPSQSSEGLALARHCHYNQWRSFWRRGALSPRQRASSGPGGFSRLPCLPWGAHDFVSVLFFLQDFFSLQSSHMFHLLYVTNSHSRQVSQVVKNPPANAGAVWFLSWEDPLEGEMATHSSILAWEMP